MGGVTHIQFQLFWNAAGIALGQLVFVATDGMSALS